MLKIILKIIFGVALITGIYFSYQYYIYTHPTETPPENIIQEMEVSNDIIFGKVIEITSKKITIEQMENLQNQDIYLNENTIYYNFSPESDERKEIKVEDIKTGMEVSIIYFLNKDDNKKYAKVIDTISQQ